MRALRAAALCSCLFAFITLVQSPGLSSAVAQSSSARANSRPNILLITTDDERLADQAYMPRTNALIAAKGTSFVGISPNPLCCPARAEILTGQFSQNNGVRTNSGPYGGYGALDPYDTIATWLAAAGYTTAFMGKYLNQYAAFDTGANEPGWDFWEPTVDGIYNYFNFVTRHDHELLSHNQYQPDYFTELGVQELDQLAQQSQPFFMWQSYVAPHSTCTERRETCWRPPASAPRFTSLFHHVMLDSVDKPSFNEADMSDKPPELSSRPQFDSTAIAQLERQNRQRLRALQAVDGGVARMIRVLRDRGVLDNTVIIFTSDNGFSLGEHRLMGKIYGYEEPLRVPLMIRGPGIPAHRSSHEVATTADIGTTIAAVAHATPTLTTDGRNLVPMANGRSRGWNTVLVQDGPLRTESTGPDWFYRGVRTRRYTYLQYQTSPTEELYDRKVDPYEVTSVANDHRYAAVLAALRHRLSVLEDCAGSSCRQSFKPLPSPSL